MENNFTPLLTLLNTKIKDIKQYESEYKKLDKEIKRLESKGIINAKPSWREKKYFYLVHPMVKGKRKFEYIGKDKTKIKEAKEKIENYNKQLNKKERQKQIINEINDFQQKLEPRYW